MVDDKAHDPAAVVKDILANGPLLVGAFRKLAHQRGIPVKDINKAADAAGAHRRRQGRPGEGGWVMTLEQPADEGIITRPGRQGFYAHVTSHGKEVQQKLGNTIEEARERMARLKEKLQEEAQER